MPTPDSKYIPQAKGKKKAVKIKKTVASSTYPSAIKRVEIKPLKKKSPFGDHYVWSK